MCSASKSTEGDRSASKLPEGDSAAAPSPYDPNERLTTAASQYDANVSFDVERLIETLGTTDRDFIWGLTQQLIHVGDCFNFNGLSFMFAVIKSIKPNDQLEAMLAAQMAAIHLTMMTFAARLTEVENIPQQDSTERECRG